MAVSATSSSSGLSWLVTGAFACGRSGGPTGFAHSLPPEKMRWLTADGWRPDTGRTTALSGQVTRVVVEKTARSTAAKRIDIPRGRS